MDEIPRFADIEAAAAQIAGHAVRTPLLDNAVLNDVTGREVLVKPEMLQRSGSFKFRGAYNRLSRLNAEEREQGVVAWSSGNHAQGVAAAAALLRVRARIVMPDDAPAIKRDNTLALGGEIVSYDRYTQNRETIARELVARDGGVIVPSYDDPWIIAGQGTAGLEIFNDARARGVHLDALLVCCGGGGLTAGCALAAAELSSDTAVYAVEPEGYDDHARSLQSGRRESADTSTPSLCDALLTPSPGELTFAINRDSLAGAFVVSENEVRAAMRFAFRELKLVVEPGGAVALAALLANKLPACHERVAIILSGGNVDPDLFSKVLS